MMPKYFLSPEAQASLQEIRKFSVENFGMQQTKIYLENIREKMRSLAENPLSGKLREELKAGYFSAFVGTHTIYYKIQSSHIEIIDVLHQSMEPSRHIF